ncbi:hypothetical protein PLICRDRAFT_38521 [Plicaturopsis crispa FD-325 SS-3]|nr:hypothetical protein PLICRDRAFT_38521 [Plicaturopsis crispa FD-325 SS-3]
MSEPFAPNEDPLRALCRHYNVAVTPHTPGLPLPQTFDMPILRDAHMPTHVLAIYDKPGVEHGLPGVQPLMAPIHADAFVRRFRIDVIPAGVPGSTLPVPHHSDNGSGQVVVTLPVVPLQVPHAPSVPLLLLFSLHPQLQPGDMAWRLLPPDVIEEFPMAATMAQILSRYSDRALREYVTFNQGLWKNVLALAATDVTVVKMVQTAWNVTADARRIRQREHNTSTR